MPDTMNPPTSTSVSGARSQPSGGELRTEDLPDLVTYVKTYAKQNPDVAAMWCFGVGFVLGWKLKPW
ncbi:hypothetical protein [Botrimarina sp.]|uniref:hypothetical protein n=1 Tax=Botrimarina sp. TaxID=2795802 RepID=UPI0032EFDF08